MPFHGYVAQCTVHTLGGFMLFFPRFLHDTATSCLFLILFYEDLSSVDMGLTSRILLQFTVTLSITILVEVTRCAFAGML